MNVDRDIDGYSMCLHSAITDLRHYKRVFVYKSEIVEELKEKFDDLIIRKGDFYWEINRKRKGEK